MPDKSRDWEDEEQTIVSFAEISPTPKERGSLNASGSEDKEATIFGSRRALPADATVVAGGGPRLQAIEAIAWLVITRTPSVRKGQIFSLEKIRTEIGRGSDVDIFLNDPQVGRTHAAVRYEGPEDGSGNFMLHDLASAGGTLLNGERIGAPVALKDGDRIGLGATELVFKSV